MLERARFSQGDQRKGKKPRNTDNPPTLSSSNPKSFPHNPPTKMKPSKCLAKEKGKEEGTRESKESILKPNNISKFCFLYKSKLWNGKFAHILNRRPQSAQFVNGLRLSGLAHLSQMVTRKRIPRSEWVKNQTCYNSFLYEKGQNTFSLK